MSFIELSIDVWANGPVVMIITLLSIHSQSLVGMILKDQAVISFSTSSSKISIIFSIIKPFLSK